MTNKIQLQWTDGILIDIELLDNPAAEYYSKCIKHLQYIDLTFDARTDPFHPDIKNHTLLANRLATMMAKFNITVDQSRLTNQQYLNYLHTIYFENANSTNYDYDWLLIHNLIHLVEGSNGAHQHTEIWFDYSANAGPLIKPFNRTWLKYAVTEVPAGTCYIQAFELGKDPYVYYQDNEPADINVICELMKPWVYFKPVMCVATHDKIKGLHVKPNADLFGQWFAPFKEQWTKHWNAIDWEFKEIYSVIPIGQCSNIPLLVERFTAQNYPIRIIPGK